MAMENGPFEDVSPIQNGIFHCYVRLPECSFNLKRIPPTKTPQDCLPTRRYHSLYQISEVCVIAMQEARVASCNLVSKTQDQCLTATPPSFDGVFKPIVD